MKKTKFFGMMLFALALATTACSNVNDPDPDPTVETGDGTKAKPYSVAEIITLNPQSTSEAVKTAVWTKGFIVGYYNSTPNPAVVEAVAPFTDDVNIMLAVSATETDKTKMLSIQLPAGAVRTALGLKTTPANFGKEILVHGDVMKYNTFPGVKNTNGYWFVEANTGMEPVIDTDEATGNGTEVSPYNVAGARANQGAAKWVEAYIVGNVDGEGIDMTTDSKFEAPFAIKTNILIAAKANETDYNKCFPVQLSAGAIRDGLNLADNASNLGKKVKLYGSLEVYYGKPGMKTTSYFEFEGGTSGGTKPVDTSNAIFSESFMASSQGNFTVENVVLPTGFTSIWLTSATYGMVATAFKVSSFPSESWLISPAINLAGKTNVTLNFEHAIGPAAQLGIDKSFFTVWISNNYTSGAPSAATWTQIPLTSFSTAAWGYIGANLAIPTSNLAANAKIAFKYMSTASASATWEIKNVVIK